MRCLAPPLERLTEAEEHEHEDENTAEATEDSPCPLHVATVETPGCSPTQLLAQELPFFHCSLSGSVDGSVASTAKDLEVTTEVQGEEECTAHGEKENVTVNSPQEHSSPCLSAASFSSNSCDPKAGLSDWNLERIDICVGTGRCVRRNILFTEQHHALPELMSLGRRPRRRRNSTGEDTSRVVTVEINAAGRPEDILERRDFINDSCCSETYECSEGDKFSSPASGGGRYCCSEGSGHNESPVNCSQYEGLVGSIKYDDSSCDLNGGDQCESLCEGGHFDHNDGRYESPTAGGSNCASHVHSGASESPTNSSRNDMSNGGGGDNGQQRRVGEDKEAVARDKRIVPEVELYTEPNSECESFPLILCKGRTPTIV